MDSSEEELKSLKEKSTAKEDEYTSTIEQLTEVCPSVCAYVCTLIHVMCQVKITLGNQIMALDRQLKETQGQGELLQSAKVNNYYSY